eukprot:COSAG06_NODE_8481_length_2155_cov_1.578512_1_plen_362_part_00
MDPSALPRGFRNRGDDCFVCAALQCIAHDTALRDYLMLAARPTEAAPLAAALVDVLSQLQERSAEPVDPSRFRATLALSAPQFAGDGQGDASELFAWLLSGLHDELRTLQTACDREGESPGPGDDAWLAYWQTNSSRIVEMRHGMQHTISECQDCHQRTDEPSPFAMLSLSLPAGPGLAQPLDLRCCINGWCLPTIAPTVVFCSHCDDFRPGTQQRTVGRLPPCLTFHIQRLDEHALHAAVTCPVSLPSEVLRATALTVDGDRNDGESELHIHPAQEYELFAVTHIAHAEGLGSTHYYSCCQVCQPASQQPAPPRTSCSRAGVAQGGGDHGWLRFDDEDVQAVDECHAVSGIVHMACYRLK